MEKRIKKQFWVNEKQAELLKQKSKRTGLTEAGLLRLLIEGYSPKEKPDKEFYEAVYQVRKIGNTLNQIAASANAIGTIDVKELEKALEDLHNFEADIEDAYIVPERGLLWQ